MRGGLEEDWLARRAIVLVLVLIINQSKRADEPALSPRRKGNGHLSVKKGKRKSGSKRDPDVAIVRAP